MEWSQPSVLGPSYRTPQRSSPRCFWANIPYPNSLWTTFQTLLQPPTPLLLSRNINIEAFKLSTAFSYPTTSACHPATIGLQPPTCHGIEHLPPSTHHLFPPCFDLGLWTRNFLLRYSRKFLLRYSRNFLLRYARNFLLRYSRKFLLRYSRNFLLRYAISCVRYSRNFLLRYLCVFVCLWIWTEVSLQSSLSHLTPPYLCLTIVLALCVAKQIICIAQF